MNLLQAGWDWYTNHQLGFWVGIVFFGTFLALFRMSWPAMAGLDAGWNEDKFRQIHPNSSWNKAATRRHSWMGIGVLLYMLWVGAMLWQLNAGYDPKLYFSIAALWLITTPLRSFWLVVIVRRSYASRGLELKRKSLWDEFASYYENATRRPEGYGNEVRPWFQGRLKFLNAFQKFRVLGQVFHWRAIYGLFRQMVVSVAWPIAMPSAVFWYMKEAERYSERRAWWSYSKHRH